MGTSNLLITHYGFTWGPFKVERICHGPQVGWVLCVTAGDEEVELRTSEKGRKGIEVQKRKRGQYQ